MLENIATGIYIERYNRIKLLESSLSCSASIDLLPMTVRETSSGAINRTASEQKYVMDTVGYLMNKY
jgi:hypothetical protein